MSVVAGLLKKKKRESKPVTIRSTLRSRRSQERAQAARPLMARSRFAAAVAAGSSAGSAAALFFFKQKTAYEISTRDWSSDVCSSDLFRFKAGTLQVLAGCSIAGL